LSLRINPCSCRLVLQDAGGFFCATLAANTRLHRRFGVTFGETQREVARLLPVLKERYWRDRITTNSRRLQICVHVRRGDVSKKHYPHMWTPTASIERPRLAKSSPPNCENMVRSCSKPCAVLCVGTNDCRGHPH